MSTRDYANAYIRLQMLESLTVGWTLSTYVLFILSTGHSLLDANIANTIFMLTNFALDPITGKWGDVYGYRRVYLGGLLVWGIGMFTYSIGFSLLHFCIAEFFAGIGKALLSEALESWVENSVPFRAAVFIKARGDSQNRIMIIFSAILGSIIGALFGMRWPWLLAAISSAVVFVIAWRMLSKFPKSEHGHQLDGEESQISVLAAWHKSWHTPGLRFMLIFTAIFFAAAMPLNMFHSPLLKELSGDSWWLGFLWIGISLAIAKGSRMTERRTKVTRQMLAIVIAGMSLMILVASLSSAWVIVLIGFLAHEVPRGMIRNLSYSFANPLIEKRERSMINSIRSAVGTFGAALGLIVSGLLSQIMRIQQIWFLVALLLFLYAGITWLQERRK